MIEAIVCLYLLSVLVNMLCIRKVKAGKWVIINASNIAGVPVFFKQKVTVKQNVIKVEEIFIDRTSLDKYSIEVEIVSPDSDMFSVYGMHRRDIDEQEKMQLFKMRASSALFDLIKKKPQYLKRFTDDKEPYSYQKREVWMLDFWLEENGR